MAGLPADVPEPEGPFNDCEEQEWYDLLLTLRQRATGGALNGKIKAENVLVTNPGFSNQQEVNDALLYVPLAVAGFSQTLGVQLIGSTVQTVVLNWAYNKAVASQTVAGQVLTREVRSLTLNNLNLTANEVFHLDASDGQRNAGATCGLYFANDRFWGVGPAGLTDPAQLTGGGTDRTEGRAGQFTVNAGAGKKIYWVRPARFGPATYAVGGFTGGFTERTVSYTNAVGYTEDYLIGETVNAGLGPTTYTTT
jgi:hypothetical protein